MLPLNLIQPEPIPARCLNEFTYCPRLGYLEWVQREWAENVFTRDGEFVHRNVDREDRRAVPAALTDLPPDSPPESSSAPTDDTPSSTGSEAAPAETTLHTRSLRLESPTLGLVAVVDIVELDGPIATPVDYKRGSAPDLPEGAYEPERVQLAAQGLLLREAGYQSHEGILYFQASRQRVVIPFDEGLLTRTQEQIQAFRAVADAGVLPPPLVDSPKCPRCSLVSICLPDETNYLRAMSTLSEKTDDRPAADPLRPALVPREDAIPLHITEPYGKLSKVGDRLRVEVGGETVASIRLHDVSQVSLYGNIQVTTQCLAELMEREIPVAYFTFGGWFRGFSQGLGHKNVEARIQQYRTAFDPAASLAIAQAMIQGKIRNGRTLIRRNDDRDDDAASQRTLNQLEDYAQRIDTATTHETLLGLEGMAAKVYFEAFATLFKEPAKFEGRHRRPPTDPVNAALSFLYSLLTKECHVQLASVGLDPMLGVLHKPRYGRPALALDLAEEFRPLLADSTALSLFNTQELNPKTHFVTRAGLCNFTPAGRKILLTGWERRLSTEITHPLFKYVASYRRIVALQARILMRTFLGEFPRYVPFKTR